MDDATWSRHANPWSGWSRVPVLPLMALSIWSRIWFGWWVMAPLVLLLLWVFLNPRVFPPPRDKSAWMTRAVLGERVWLGRGTRPIPRHHARMAGVLSAVAGVGLVPLAAGLWQLDAGLTLTGLVTCVGGKLWFLDRMVWLWHDMGDGI